MKRFIALKILPCLLLGAVSVASAGNQQMVEKRVQELEQEQQRALDLIPAKPKDGTITFKTYIRNDKNEWVEYKVVDSNDEQKSKSGKVILQGGKLP